MVIQFRLEPGLVEIFWSIVNLVVVFDAKLVPGLDQLDPTVTKNYTLKQSICKRKLSNTSVTRVFEYLSRRFLGSSHVDKSYLP
jgi:hypothetical protein